MATQDPLASLEGDMLDVAPGVKPVDGDVKATEHVERLANVETNSTEKNGNASNGEVQECDVLVVGAGFSGEYMSSDTRLGSNAYARSGITAIHRFRKQGLKVKCFEGASGFGGTWHWNVSLS